VVDTKIGDSGGRCSTVPSASGPAQITLSGQTMGWLEQVPADATETVTGTFDAVSCNASVQIHVSGPTYTLDFARNLVFVSGGFAGPAVMTINPQSAPSCTVNYTTVGSR
jgi:hypothetical protein